MNTEIFNFTINYNNDIIQKLSNKLINGSVGIFPTDTVYGIGCSTLNENSINELFKLKLRDYSKPINVLVSNLNMLDNLVENISAQEQKLIDTFWPGALTIVFNKKSSVSDLLTSDLNTVGVRMPNNQIALDLIEYTNTPIAATSVNISGKPSGISKSDFINDFNNKVDFIIDNGNTRIQKASTIVQIIDGEPKILRKGSITKKEIYKALENK